MQALRLVMLALAVTCALVVAAVPVSHAQGRTIQSFQISDMDFGEFVALAASGRIILSPTGTATYDGVLATGGAVATAEFEIHGERFDTFIIDLPSQVVIPGATGDMVINNFTSEPSGIGTFNAQGKAFVKIGATMNMTNTMAAGLYTDTFSVTFTYEVWP